MKYLVLITAPLILLTAALTPTAHADIYKCTDEHGNVAYLQTPCPAEEAVQDEELTEASPAPQSPDVQVPSSRRPGEPLDDCKKRYRDQIDEIDAEMQTVFSSEQGEAYKEKLLALTKQLRACS